MSQYQLCFGATDPLPKHRLPLLLLWTGYYVASETGWLYVYVDSDQFDDVNDVIYLIGGVVLVSAAVCQLVKGVLQ